MTSNDDGSLLVDGGDLGCARLLVLLRNVARGLHDGAVVHLLTTDPVAPIDLPAWCRMTGHSYLGPVARHDRPCYGIAVSARATPTRSDSVWRVASTSPADEEGVAS
ncbi:sulfurtransferase TusA family protein [Nocardioides sp. JQ2195]|uniref:sulfurtransferase TusA family protein n=1 Tax=Nocardioides sp. JQ2195 TaxID=2592334 RepID=UPI00143E5D5A|nr:sulfurtransferase TusA family protein [Nocardioides sp. JQ2195]QIX26471.1 sulfurtransferase TusA family protein [Nocardioides sp. JQ2195]